MGDAGIFPAFSEIFGISEFCYKILELTKRKCIQIHSILI